MRLTVWHELDIPMRPVNDDEVAVVKASAIKGKDDAYLLEGSYEKHVDLLGGKVGEEQNNDLSPEHYIGYALGLRAHAQDLEVGAFSRAGGYLLGGTEMEDLRRGKATGSRFALLKEQRELPFRDVFGQCIEEAKWGVDNAPMTTFVGQAIGVRAVQLQLGVKV